MNSDFITLLMKKIEQLDDFPVTAVTYGPHMVAVESRKTGVATWAWNNHPVPLEILPNPDHHYSGKTLARMIQDDHPLKASLGMAALNSLLPEIPPQYVTTLNAGDLIIQLGKHKRVAIIGHFPFIKKMQGKFKELMVFEKSPKSGDLEENLIPCKLHAADIVAVTATTIANKTLENILSNCREGAVKMIIGPSTPLCNITFELGFDYVAGTLVEDAVLLKEGIVNGYTFKQVRGVNHVILHSV
jgi:hypothetical protein